MNELASLVANYFADNMAELRRLGVPFTHLRYSSRKSIPRNAEKLHRDILSISAKVRAVHSPHFHRTTTP